MTWNAYHRRGETLRAVTARADERRDGLLPRDVPGLTEHFADDLDVVGALQLRWHARLTAHLERALATDPTDPPGAVVAAWRATAQEMPGTRRVLDRCAAEGDEELRAAVARATDRERARLGVAAGLAGRHGRAAGRDAVAAGRALEHLARAVPTTPITPFAQEVTMTEQSTPYESVEPTPTTESAESTEGRERSRAAFVQRIKAALAAA